MDVLGKYNPIFFINEKQPYKLWYLCCSSYSKMLLLTYCQPVRHVLCVLFLLGGRGVCTLLSHLFCSWPMARDRVCPWSLNEINGDQSTWRISPEHWKLPFNYVLKLTLELLRLLKPKIIKPLRLGTWIFWLFRFDLAYMSVLFIPVSPPMISCW